VFITLNQVALDETMCSYIGTSNFGGAAPALRWFFVPNLSLSITRYEHIPRGCTQKNAASPAVPLLQVYQDHWKWCGLIGQHTKQLPYHQPYKIHTTLCK